MMKRSIFSDPKEAQGLRSLGEYSENLANAAAGAPLRERLTRAARPFDFSGFDWGAASVRGQRRGSSSFRDIFADLFQTAAKPNATTAASATKRRGLEMPLSAFGLKKRLRGSPPPHHHPTVNRSDHVRAATARRHG